MRSVLRVSYTVYYRKLGTGARETAKTGTHCFPLLYGNLYLFPGHYHNFTTKNILARFLIQNTTSNALSTGSSNVVSKESPNSTSSH
eukprot:3163723-Rhodomonas_salina.2